MFSVLKHSVKNIYHWFKPRKGETKTILNIQLRYGSLKYMWERRHLAMFTRTLPTGASNLPNVRQVRLVIFKEGKVGPAYDGDGFVAVEDKLVYNKTLYKGKP